VNATVINVLAFPTAWALASRSALLLLSLTLFAPRAPAQVFSNLSSLVYQIRDPSLSGDNDGPKNIATADFNGDGKPDLAVANTDG